MNTSIALVPFSDPRTRLSRFVFAPDFFFALERIRFTDFIESGERGQISARKAFANHGRHGDQDGQG